MHSSWQTALFLCALILSGCSAAPGFVSTNTSSNQQRGAALRGVVHGGQAPISGAHVYLYAVNTTGYGGAGIAASSSNASISLLTSATGNPPDVNGDYYVVTDSKGAWGITGDYTCPSAASQVYLYGIGGDAGAGANSAAGLMAALGTCPANGEFSPSLYIVLNEVSTVATAWASAGFATDALHISSSSSPLALTGVANAFAAVPNMETLGAGTALAKTPAGNGTVQQVKINTLANILGSCVNSNGAVSGPTSPTPCYTLFTKSLSGGSAGLQPTDTATAAINIAHNPTLNVSNLYGLQTASSPFQPGLTSAPPNFLIANQYTGGGLGQPTGIAIDSSGDVWVTNFLNSISKFSPTGTPLSTASGFQGGGLSGPTGIAIDNSGNVWTANYNLGRSSSLSEFNSAGSATSPATTGYAGGGLAAPYYLAIDASGNVWAANKGGNSISEFSSTGSAISPAITGFAGGGLDGPVGIVLDASGDVWVTNNGDSSISEFDSSNGSAISSASGYTGGGLDTPWGIALDGSGDIWTANEGNSSISEFDSTNGSAITGASGYTGGGLSAPEGISVDSANDVWVVSPANGISEFSSSGTVICGSGCGVLANLDEPANAAIDGSGNLWVVNTNSTAGPGSVDEFIGAAAPVVTPIVANLLSPYGSAAVNKP